ncbi:MAG: DUF927 domain-containing protein, partial [Zetaproteobacteria bacterium]|nr:DUF927 domain-containing protein [Zetaproteobacteria bacterium]
SVWGCGPNQNLVRKWRSTVNGLEHLAESSNDSLLVLDELAEIGSKSAGQAAYMLANGSGKQRLNKDGKAKKCARWRTLFLSSGEIGLAEHLGETGEQMRGGQHIRLVDIEADAGQGHGVFDHVPVGTTAAELADTLSLQTARYGGAPIRAYLKLLTQDTDIPAALTRYEQAFLHEVQHTRLTRQARRVAKRFALIAASGCYAASQGILPWSAEENMAAVQACFEDWWAKQPPAEDFEETRALEQVRSFLENNAYSHFPEANTLRLGGYQGKFTGFREKNPDGEWEWFVLASCFSDQVCKGLKVRQVTKVLRKHNCLYLQDNRSTKPVRCPGQGLKRMYHFRAGALNIPYAEEMEGGEVTAVTADTVLPQGEHTH